LSCPFQVKAAYSDGHLRESPPSCSDAFQIVRQLYVSALESGDIDIWKASLLQESDLDAAHVEAIVQSIQARHMVIAFGCTASQFFSQADSSAASRIHVRQVRALHSFDRKYRIFMVSFSLQLQSIGWKVSLAVASSVEEAAPQGLIVFLTIIHLFILTLQPLYRSFFAYPTLMETSPWFQLK
jgi:hypothetical protein